MTTCLLCPSPAVQDGLCVPDGARLWAAKLWLDKPASARGLLGSESWMATASKDVRIAALQEIDAHDKARVFFSRLDAARAERKRAEDERSAR